MNERTRRRAGRPLVLAWLAALGLVATAAPAVSARRATTDAGYTVLSLKATINSTQIAHVGPGQDGDGAAGVELVSLNKPFFTLPKTATPRRVALRVRGSGDARAHFVFAARGTLPTQTVECASSLRMEARAARATFQVVHGRGGRRMVRVRVTLPYVRAPYVEATDLYPPSGPCPVEHEHLHLTRTVPLLLFARPRLVLRLGGKRTSSSGDITYTTSWSVALTLRRRA